MNQLDRIMEASPAPDFRTALRARGRSSDVAPGDWTPQLRGRRRHQVALRGPGAFRFGRGGIKKQRREEPLYICPRSPKTIFRLTEVKDILLRVT